MPASRTSDEESPATIYEACGIPLRRSQRPAWSCTECTRRKIKCSKQVPCTACDRKKRGHLCRVEPHGPATSLRNAARLISECNPDLRLASGVEIEHLRASVTDLQHRVRQLEGAVERLLPYVPEHARAEFELSFTSSNSHSTPPSGPPLVSFPHPGASYPLLRQPQPPTAQRQGSRISNGTGQHTPVTDSSLTGSPLSPSGSGSPHEHDRDSYSDSDAPSRIGLETGPLSPAPSPPGEDVKPVWGDGSGDLRRSAAGGSAPVSGWVTPAGMMSMDELGSGLLPQAGVPMYGFGEALSMYPGASPYTMAAPAQRTAATY